MADKRITDQVTDTTLSAGDYIMVDSSGEGTRKFDLGTKLAAIDTAITEEATAREAADSQLKEDLSQESNYQMLLCDEVPDTVQSYTFSGGSVSQVAHNRSNTAIRTDAFTYTDNTITEVRTLNTGETLTIVTNLTTLETTVTYAEA